MGVQTQVDLVSRLVVTLIVFDAGELLNSHNFGPDAPDCSFFARDVAPSVA